MELVRAETSLEQLGDVLARSEDSTLVFRILDADTVIALAARASEVTAPLGVWLEATTQYPAQLIARDVATLAALVPIHHAVIDAASLASEHANVVRALLTNEEVNFENDVVTLRGAYNRPAPPESVTVWHAEGESIVSEETTLHIRLVENRADVALTYFD
jgi:hypothetical protein